MKKLLCLATVLALFLSACGGSEPNGVDAETETGSETTAEQDEAASDPVDDPVDESGDGIDDDGAETASDSSSIEPSAAVSELLASGSFCDVARRLEEDSPVGNLDIVDGVEEFYDDVLSIWDGLAQLAPDEIKDDLAAIRDQFAGQREIAAQFEFDLTSLEAAEEIGNMDTTAADAAQIRMESYLVNECGLDLGQQIEGTFEPAEGSGELNEVDPEDVMTPELQEAIEGGDAAALLIALFGVEPDVANCLVEELDIDTPEGLGSLDPERLAEPVCGTSMIEVISGE